MKNETALPKSWVVKNDDSQLFKDEVIKYLNENYNRTWQGSNTDGYYGIENEKPFFTPDKTDFSKDVIEFSIKQFIFLKNKGIPKDLDKIETEKMAYPHNQRVPMPKLKVFKLPERWAVSPSSEEEKKMIGNYADKIYNDKRYENLISDAYYHFPKYNMLCTNNFLINGYEQITFEEFEKYVLNKVILKYKIKDDCIQYAEAAYQIAYTSSFIKTLTEFEPNSNEYRKIKQFKLLNFWFEPVYKEEIKEKNIFVGSSNISVYITKNLITADNHIISINEIQRVYKIIIGENNNVIFSLEHNTGGYKITFPKGCKIGCAEFTAEELKYIIDTYNEINNIN